MIGDDEKDEIGEAEMAPSTEEGAVPDDEEADGEPEVIDFGALPGRVAGLTAEIAELKDRLLRAVAETENVRKRGQRQLEDVRRYGVSDLARDLLNVSDNLRRALDSVPKDAIPQSEALANLVDGLEAVERDFMQSFENHHIKKIADADVPFDHNIHQAMFELPGTGKPSGTVVQLMQPGYMLHDRLLRPAMVGVAAHERAPDDGDEPEEPGARIDTSA